MDRVCRLRKAASENELAKLNPSGNRIAPESRATRTLRIRPAAQDSHLPYRGLHRSWSRNVLLDLASNAVKFTSRGHVLITRAGERALIRFTVEDTGIGIPSDVQKHVFQKFTQADGSISPNSPNHRTMEAEHPQALRRRANDDNVGIGAPNRRLKSP